MTLVLVLLGALVAAPVIVIIVAIVTGDFDFTNRHPERRDIYRRWRKP